MKPSDPRPIPVAGPSITDLEVSYVSDAIRHAWYEGAGSYVRRFEEAFKSHTSRNFAFALPSCTSAIHLALAAANIGVGDEVIVPDLTWIGSSAAISYVGATPIFADVDPNTWCLSLETIKAVASPQTKAVIAVNLYGSMPNYSEIEMWAADNDILVIEDAAESIGSTWDDRRAGNFGSISVFSFHGSKTMTTGEGGMLVCDDPKLAERIGILRDHGRLPGDQLFYNSEIAFKYKMTDLQAALGLAQLERISELVEFKRSIFLTYQKLFANVSYLTMNCQPPRMFNSYWMTTVIMGAEINLHKNQLHERLRIAGISSRPFFHPLSALPAYAGALDRPRASTENKVSYGIGSRGINLPSALSLTVDQIDYVANSLMEILEASLYR